MQQSTRLALNTVVTYGRMAFTVGLGLATTRLIFSKLGIENFGVYAVLTSISSLFVTASNASVASIQRHLAVAIGSNDRQCQGAIFITSASVHIAAAFAILALAFILSGSTVGLLNIPLPRVPEAQTTLFYCLAISTTSIFFAPVTALYAAHQRMEIDAGFNIAISLGNFLIALGLPTHHTQNLELYVRYQLALQLIVFASQSILAARIFNESRALPKEFSVPLLRPIFGLAGWSLLGILGWIIRMSGGAILLNIFFGPVANAGYAIGQQATSYILNFSNVIMRAVQPAMSTLEGQRRTHQWQLLIHTTTKLMLLASSLIALPVLLAPQTAITAWIGKAPPTAAVFVCSLILSSIILQTTSGHDVAMMSRSKLHHVAWPMFWIMISPLPIAALLFKFTRLPPSAYAALLLITAFAGACFYVATANEILRLSLRSWIAGALAPSITSIAAAAIVGALLSTNCPPDLAGLSIVFGATSLTLMLTSYFLTIAQKKKKILRQLTNKITSRLLQRKS